MKITKRDRKALVATFIGLPVLLTIMFGIAIAIAVVLELVFEYDDNWECLWGNARCSEMFGTIGLGIASLPCIYTAYYWINRFIIGDISFLPKAFREEEYEEQDDFIQLVQNPSNEKD